MASSDVMSTRMESTAGPVVLRPRRRRVVHKRPATMCALWCFWCGLVLWSSSWRRCRSRLGVVSMCRVLRLWSMLRISRGVAALCLRRVMCCCRARSLAVPSAVGSREGCCADCGACEARDQEFLEVVVHIAPSLSVLDVTQEPASRLHPVRCESPRLLTKMFRREGRVAAGGVASCRAKAPAAGVQIRKDRRSALAPLGLARYKREPPTSGGYAGKGFRT